MTTKRKTAQSVAIKDQTTGEVEVVFATLDVKDHDGDLLRKEAFTDGAPVVISAYGHGSHRGELPLGRGRIVMTDTEAKMVGRFFLDTTHGRDAFLTVKHLSDDDGDDGGGLQEWSFNLRNVEAHSETINGEKVNVITHVDVKEVSPVLEGAGINTRTLVAKALKESASTIERNLRQAGTARWSGDDDSWAYLEDWDVDAAKAVFAVFDGDGVETLRQVSFERDGSVVTLGDDEIEVVRTVEYVPKAASEPQAQKFQEHVKAVATALAALTERAEEVVAFRAQKGKHGLAADAAAVVAAIDAQVDRLKALAGEPAEQPAPPVPSPAVLSARLALDLMEES